MRNIVAVGDIHADIRKLKDVMNQLEDRLNFKKTRFVFVGDYVDGALEAKDVLLQLREYQRDYPKWQFLKGNHEDMLVAASKSETHKWYQDPMKLWWTQGGYETFLSFAPQTHFTPWQQPPPEVVQEVIGKDMITWLDSLPLRYESDHFHFVHAGLKPDRRPNLSTDLDMLWIRDEFIQSNYDWEKKVVFGHTPQNGVLNMRNKIGIDTMRHGRGVLTAVILNDETGELVEIVQSYNT